MVNRDKSICSPWSCLLPETTGHVFAESSALLKLYPCVLFFDGFWES